MSGAVDRLAMQNNPEGKHNIHGTMDVTDEIRWALDYAANHCQRQSPEEQTHILLLQPMYLILDMCFQLDYEKYHPVL